MPSSRTGFLAAVGPYVLSIMVDAVRAMRAGAPAVPDPSPSEGGALTPVLVRR